MSLNTEERIIRAKVQMLRKSPFFGYLSAYLRPQPQPSIGTAGVNKNGVLYYNPAWIDSLSEANLQATIAHEVMHCAMLTFERCGSRDHELWNYACVKPSQFIIGCDKSIKNCKIGDKVFNSDGIGKIVEIHNRNYTGKLLKIKAAGILPITITENHPLLVIKKKASGGFTEPKWVESQLITKRNYLLIPREYATMNIHTLDLSEFINVSLTNNHTQSHNVRIKKIIINPKTAWLMGFYTAEGSSNSKNNNGINLAIGARNYSQIKKINNIFKEIGYPVKSSKQANKNCIVLKINSTIISRAFKKWFGRGARNKTIPDFILFNSNLNILRAYLNGYLQGDGHKHGKEQMCHTSSKKLALRLQIALTRVGGFGFLTRIRQRKRIINSKELKRTFIYKLCWQINYKVTKRYLDGRLILGNNMRHKILPKYIALKIRRINSSKYNGQVWNIETDNHNYLISNIITHNCDFVNNQILDENGFQLPKDVLLDSELTKDKTAEEVYEILYKSAKRIPEHYCLEGDMLEDSQGNDQNQSGKTPSAGKEKGGGQPNGANPITHVDEDKPIDWKEKMAEAAAYSKQIGNEAAGMARLYDATLNPKANWRALLNRYISNLANTDYTFNRPNRRHIANGLYLPSMEKESLNIVFAVDTSGSMGRQELSEAYTELLSVKDSFANMHMTIITCDSEVHEVIEVNNHDVFPNVEMRGGGGTNFSPIFSKIADENMKPSVLVVATDLYGSFPNAAPEYPVLWLTKTHNVEIPFGEKIMVD